MAPSRLDRFMGFFAVSVMFTYAHLLVPLMDNLHVKGGFILGPMVLPILIYALAVARGGMGRRELLPALALLAIAILSGLWSKHSVDAISKSLPMLVILALAALFYCRPAFLESCVRWAFLYSLAAPVYLLVIGDKISNVGYSLQMFALFGAIHVHRRIPKRWAILTAEIVLSTFRAATIGLMLGLAATLFRTTRARAIAGFCILTATLAVSLSDVESTYHAPRPNEVERTDIAGRFQMLGEDRGSRRFDIWEAVYEDISAHPNDPENFYGRGIGDIDYYVASVFPDFASKARGEPILSTHNTFLELYLSAGLIVVPFLLWFLWSVVRGARLDEPSGAIGIAAGCIALANVSLYDLSGSVACIGLLMALLRYPAREAAQVMSFADWVRSRVRENRNDSSGALRL